MSQATDTFVTENRPRLLEELKDFLRIPSISTLPEHKEDIKRAAQFVADRLKQAGIENVEIIPTAGNPLVYGDWLHAPGKPTVLCYGHYDVQPPDPLDLWRTPPFDPVVRDGRLWGRGAADNKGPLMTHIAAVGRLLEKNPRLPLRITFMIEGEEEIGSPSFLPFLESHRQPLKADLVFLSDTGLPREDQVVITCGLRGLVLFDVEVTSARSDLHSGLHGGVLRNPIQALAELCASFHTADGRVNIPGFYDDVLDVEPWERAELRKLGQDEAAYREFLGIPAFYTVKGYTPFEAVRFMPTLEFNGIGGGYQGEGTKTVIPSKAIVKISCRLVPNQKPEKIRPLLYAAVRQRMPEDVTFRIIDQHDGTPYTVVPPGRSNTPKDQPPLLAKAFRAADAAATEIFGRPPLYLREGGSVPIIADVKRVLGIDSVLLGLSLPEDNLHAPNESFNLRVMERGMAVSEKVLSALAEG